MSRQVWPTSLEPVTNIIHKCAMAISERMITMHSRGAIRAVLDASRVDNCARNDTIQHLKIAIRAHANTVYTIAKTKTNMRNIASYRAHTRFRDSCVKIVLHKFAYVILPTPSRGSLCLFSSDKFNRSNI